MAKYQTPKAIGKNRNVAASLRIDELSIFVNPWIIKLKSCITTTAKIPKNDPKNAPEIGENKSNRVNLTLAPTRTLIGIWSAINPKTIKNSKNQILLFMILNTLSFILDTYLHIPGMNPPATSMFAPFI